MSYTDYEEIQVTQFPDQVHCLTKAGWKLVDIITSGEVAHSHQDVANPGGNCGGCNNYHSGGHSVVTGSVVVTKPVYVLGLQRDAVVDGLRTDLDLSKGVVSAQEREIKRLAKETADGELALGDQRESNKSLHERIERLTEDVKQKDKLEQHLSKAKKLVGERDWKREVLGEVE